MNLLLATYLVVFLFLALLGFWRDEKGEMLWQTDIGEQFFLMILCWPVLLFAGAVAGMLFIVTEALKRLAKVLLIKLW